MYSVFLQAWMHLEEIEFSIISAFKSRVNPGRYVLYAILFVGYILSNLTATTHSLLLLFLGNGELLLLIVALVSLLLSIVAAWSFSFVLL